MAGDPVASPDVDTVQFPTTEHRKNIGGEYGTEKWKRKAEKKKEKRRC
jgi:hypothetical protein